MTPTLQQPPKLPADTHQYTACDILLLFQVYYYRWRKRQREVAASEHQPLLDNPEPPKTFNPGIPMWISYPLLIIFVIVSGFAAYYISPKEDDSPEKGPSGTVEFEWRSQVLGYASCLLYIGSRIPQIFHNFKTRCEGLSLAMFFFSISGSKCYDSTEARRRSHTPRRHLRRVDHVQVDGPQVPYHERFVDRRCRSHHLP